MKNALIAVVIGCLATAINASAATILTDLKTIDSDANTVNSQFKSYTGQSSQGFAMAQSLNKFDSDIKQGTSDCQKESVWSSTDCQTELNYVNNTLEPDVKATLATLKSKKATVQQAGATNTVKSSLQTLKTDMDSLMDCLKSKCPSSLATQATAMKTKMDADFNDAISYYSS